MTRHETFAADSLQGLIAARTNLDIAGEVEMAWRYADAMEAEARLREAGTDDDSPGAREARRDALLDQGIDTVELVTSERFADMLTGGAGAGDEDGAGFTERETAAIGETIGNYGLAVGVSDAREYQRCEISGFQCWCRTYTFHVQVGDE